MLILTYQDAIMLLLNQLNGGVTMTQQVNTTTPTEHQLPNGALADQKVNAVDDNVGIVKEAIGYAIKIDETKEEGKQARGMLEDMSNVFKDVGISAFHFCTPKLAHVVKLEDGTFKITENVKNPQHLPVEELEVRGEGCTASPAEAIAIRQAYFDSCDPSGLMTEIFNTPQDQRKNKHKLHDRHIFDSYNKQRDKKLATVFNALKPKQPPEKKTPKQKVIIHLDNVAKALEKLDADTMDIDKQILALKARVIKLK
jgi:hypothetical protein|tara:strand:+ start:1479 stop:2243 length:765 start_codon:yes stop_codon:yes gene_type:complete